MPLQSKCSFPKLMFERLARLSSRRFGVIKNLLPVNKHSHYSILHYDLLRPPFIIFGRRLVKIDKIVKAAGLLRVLMGTVHLALEPAFRPIAGLISRMKINAAV